jgi:outer membrane protein OmpA-like peptidoglycan-associated protein
MAAHNDEHVGLSSSLTDLMTSLAVIFILLLVASHNNKQRQVNASQQQLDETRTRFEAAQQALVKAQQQTRTTRLNMLVALQQALDVFAAQGVKAEADPRDPLGLLVLVPEGLLEFAVNRDTIPPGGLAFLRHFTPKLATTICSETFRDEISTIVIEGHTDSSGSDTINLPLSQARSMAVVQESLTILTATPALRSCFLTFLAASGRGSSEPLRDTAGKEDKARSRRVVFKIRVRSLEQRQLQEILSTSMSPPATRLPDELSDGRQ